MKKRVQGLWFLGVMGLQAGSIGNFGGAGFGNQTGSWSNSSSSVASAAPAAPTNSAFQPTDWQYLLLPVFQKYATSGLTTYFYQTNQMIPDNTFQNFLNFTQSQGSQNLKSFPDYGGQSDELAPYKVKFSNPKLNTVSLNPKTFLQYQGSTMFQQRGPGYGTGWYKSRFYEKAIETFIQNGSGNTVAQYASALVENFAARLAIGASAFIPGASQTNGGLLGQVNPQVGPVSLPSVTNSNEPQIVTDFFNAAQNAFQQARYSRLMYSFPTTADSAPSGSTAGITAQLNATTQNFSIPTNSNDANFGSPNPPALNPMNTFCGVIVINDTSFDIQQVGSNTQAGSSSNWGTSIHQGKMFANVFFLPATITTVTPTATAVAPYSSYAPVDSQSTNTLSNSNTTVTRTVSYNLVASATSSGNAPVGSQTTTISVSNQPAAGDSAQLPVYVNDGTSDLAFNETDMNNFFTVPHQWAMVIKMVQTTTTPPGSSTPVTSITPTDLGLVKLNPYDFPLNFTIASMQSTLGVSSTESSSGGAYQNAGGISLNAGPSTATTFSQSLPTYNSQKDAPSVLSNSVWDAPFYLYSLAFPQVKSVDYSFAYLVLQSLVNGYLMSNTFSTLFSNAQWPQVQSSPAYENYYNNAFYTPETLLLDQVFPTPLTSDWLGQNSPLDWLFLRSFMATRLILQTIYCPYDAFVSAGYLLNDKQTGFIKIDPKISVLEYMFNNPNKTVIIATSLNQARASYRFIYGQNYTSGTTASVSGLYQWILPAIQSSSSSTSSSSSSTN